MARLPFSATRIEGRELDLRRDKLPHYEHKIRDIDDEMENIVYNIIDVIQERARDNELRTFYFNMMSDKDYNNRDFDDLVGMIADIIDISVTEGKFRDVRDAIVPVVEDIVTTHIGYMTDEYPELIEYTDRGQERGLERATDLFIKYQKAVEVYRRSGNRVPNRGRDRDRDYEDRDRDGRSRANLGSDRGGRSNSGRRDRWERGALRGGVHGSPRRTVSRENRFGNSDQSDRFDDDVSAGRSSGRDTRRDERDEERDGRNREDRNAGRFEDSDSSTSNTRRVSADEESTRPARVQRLPGARKNDIEDALEGEKQASQQGSDNMTHQATSGKVISLLAYEYQDAWVPSVQYPHPPAFNYSQDLFFELLVDSKIVRPIIKDKDKIVDYYAHESMAFGTAPRDFKRFEDGVAKRLNTMHEALVNPSENFIIDGTNDEVTYHNRMEVEGNFMSYGMKDAMLRLNFRRFAAEREQLKAENDYQAVELAIGKSLIIAPFLVTEDEFGILEELRSVSSFTKLAEKLRLASKSIRPELFLQLDQYFTDAVNRMLRQNLSIPALSMSSFTSDWLDLFGLITEQFGEGYRDAINTHQERELRKLMNFDGDAEVYVMTQVPEGNHHLRPFVFAMPTKMISLNEVGYNLDLDMLPGVASAILPESNPFFHDLVQELLTKSGESFGRFYVQTADLRVLEASRSFMNEKAILMRLVK